MSSEYVCNQPQGLLHWSVFLACGIIPFLDTSGSKSTFVEKLFFPLVDNKISCQDLGFCSLFSSNPFKIQKF